MPAVQMELWSNSLTAQADTYQSIGDVNFGQHIVSLLLVIGLILLLAWLVKRAGWLKRNAATMTTEDTEDTEDNIIYFNQFNDQQTLVLMETDQKLRCFIYRGKKVEMAADLPGLRVSIQSSPGKKERVLASGGGTNDKFLSFRNMLIKGLGARGKKK